LTDVIMEGNLRGLRTTGGVTSIVRHCFVTGNTSIGFNAGSLDARTALMNIDSSTISGNGGWGVYSGTNATVYLSNNQITANAGGITFVGGSLVSFGNNMLAGNSPSGDGAASSTIATH